MRCVLMLEYIQLPTVLDAGLGGGLLKTDASRCGLNSGVVKFIGFPLLVG